FRDAVRVIQGIGEAKKILKEFKPDKVFCKGGYVSLPVAIAAHSLKIPVILHESDFTPGMANKIAMRFANKICLSFEETKNSLKAKYAEKAVFTGNPVRKWILKGNAEAGFKFTKLNDYRPIILVMGGSQGAQQINKLVRESLDELLKRYQIVHVTGRGNLDIGIHKTGYAQYEYLDEQLPDVYATSDMVVTRGGANSLFEIALMRKKALIIPLAMATRGDQLENAKYFVREMGWSMLAGDIERKDFIDGVELAFRNEVNKSARIENGVENIVNLLLRGKSV
ncbi:MAG: UDP-N-acetylglucosamine--N-acetylmuramyl-(pentapeptide) pyrophosphoryl-undecaprenol N-acetylglucosamine transferase, partial [Candidatus Gracilibacteria bacterium]